ncbi:Sec-independent protein translocase subunit TatA [Pseudonocardia xinjiangensis]|uniref:Sec-independent protein translocase protein TatA n=1 Tax=Pseudonocardia xinjiangensis TaxID=75289 RepID=A0ABX1RM44_9PSEU|nr:Sec-independent protein translocase subunit TatA [Pseudonocardia xinjiangensis]NMH80276.1 Sec-independent protein translocase subunit TatA [Pseudonocardia xinjiangensis]
MPSLGGWEFVILIGILVLLFGAKRLPDMARSIGQSARVFKGEMKGMKGDDAPAGDATTTTEKPAAAPAPPAALPTAQPAPQTTPVQATPVQATPVQDTRSESARATQPGPTTTGQ